MAQAWERDLLERPSTLHKARCLRGLALARRRWPDAPLPPYLQHRGSVPLPLLHMQGEEEEEEEATAAASTTTDQGQQPEQQQQQEEERRAVVVFVVEELPPDLYIELMHGLRRLE